MADIAITAANVLASSTATKAVGTAGANITAGQVLYIDTAASYVLKLADADVASPAYAVAGIALHAASTGQPIQYVTADSSFTFGGTVLAGDTIWLSDTAGGMTRYGFTASGTTGSELEAGDYVTVLGVALTTTTMKLSIIQGGVIA